MKTNRISTEYPKGIDFNNQNGIATPSGKQTAVLSQQHTLSNQKFYAMPKTAVPKKKRNQSTPKVDIYQRANERIISLLEKGEVAWYRRTWGVYGLACNYETKHVYTGVNMLFMNMLSPHPIPYYLTFRQVRKMGGKVRKGAKAEYVYFYKSYYKDENGKSISEKEANNHMEKGKEVNPIRFLKCYPVYNIEDTENIEWERPEAVNHPNNPILECELIVEEMPNKPNLERINTDEAFYDPTNDTVNVPSIKQFENSRFFYRTLFHELSHSTGHQSRLGRFNPDDTHTFGSKEYSEEELIAEISSNYLLSLAGIDTNEVMKVSTGYLKAWITKLKEDPKFIFRVAPKAQLATEFILGQKITELPQYL